MAGITPLGLFAVDLPFRKPFNRAAAERTSSYSLFLKCATDTGVAGFGESLPREYVTGESRASTFAMLRDDILPRLLEQRCDSLQRLIDARACTAANVRTSKCGGLVAAFNRAREALAAGLTLQLGCQVGESSLLSAAHLRLAQAVTYAERCFGLFLLREDRAVPLLQFGYGGVRHRSRPRRDCRRRRIAALDGGYGRDHLVAGAAN